MEKDEFKMFCKREFETRGFKKKKSMFYLNGRDLLCGIWLQKSDYGDIYYVNYCYFLEEYKDGNNYPTQYESDIYERVLVMSKTSAVHGKHFTTAQIEYKEYTEAELRLYFDKEFDEKILPPLYLGKTFILDNLGDIYYLSPLDKEKVIQKLKA